MPNLFSALPVAILAWVRASTSGLTRIEMSMRRPFDDAIEDKQLELGLGFDIDAQDVLVDRERELARGLADAGEHDLLGRHAGRARALELALRHHVGAGAEARQRLDHRLVGIRLQGVADERRHIGERAGEHAVMALERRRGIAVERGADLVRERGQVHRLGVQHAVPVGEVMHRLLSRRASRGCSAVWRRARPDVRVVGPRDRADRRLRAGLYGALLFPLPGRSGWWSRLGRRGRQLERPFASAGRDAQGQRQGAGQGQPRRRGSAEADHG